MGASMKFTVTIDDQDALDAMNAEIARIAATGNVLTGDEYLSDFCTTQHSVMREPQLLLAAQAKVSLDPDLKAYRERKEDEAKVAEAQVQVQANEDKI